MSTSAHPLTGSNRIWSNTDANNPHQYVCFRKEFDLTDTTDATACISVDSDFILWVNEHEVGRGQFSDYPDQKTYTSFDISNVLRCGTNVLCVLAYYRGEDFFEYRKGDPRLILNMNVGERQVPSDDTWRHLHHPAFSGGPMPRVTSQMGFTTCFDARRDIPWLMADYDDSNWEYARIIEGTGDGADVVERPIPAVQLLPAIPSKVVAKGMFIRTKVCETYAETMANDALVHDSCQTVLDRAGDESVVLEMANESYSGTFLIADVGHEEVGLLTLDIEADDGTIIDVGHGEHIDEGRVRTWVGGRAFADRFICRKGRNRFTLPFRRLGARYIEIHVLNTEDTARIHHVGLRPTPFPVQRLGGFETTHVDAMRTYDVSVRTLDLCMHEHYEDCPWREQALYGYDSRNQALCGYYAFGNYDFAAASFDLLGRGIRDDGMLELCAPGRVPITIPVFSLVWITEIAEYWLFSGDDSLFRKFNDQVSVMLGLLLDRYDPGTGLYHVPDAEYMWHFCEWTDGLSAWPKSEDMKTGFSAAFNIYLHEALGQWIWMLKQAGHSHLVGKYEDIHQHLGHAIERGFWSEERECYATYRFGTRLEGWHDHIQAVMLHENLVPHERRERVMNVLRSRSLVGMTLSSFLYLLRPLMTGDASSREFAANVVRENWEPMLYAGATSFWETQRGADDFGFAGSLCHGWSALPAWYYQAHVLGVEPTKPGFAEFVVHPWPDRFNEAKGRIPTPHGVIEVAWKQISDGLSLTCTGPSETQPTLAPYPDVPVIRATWNGEPMSRID
jgi:alpha-L-rhamnosidase